MDLRPMRFDGERRHALALWDPHGDLDVCAATMESSIARATERGAALAYGCAPAGIASALFDRLGFTNLGRAPLLTRPLRLSAAARVFPGRARALLERTPLVLPFNRRPRSGVREITVEDPRITRLWDRFSIDVLAAVERNADYVNPRIFRGDADSKAGSSAPPRVFIFEDGDRYVIRAMCIFRLEQRHDGRMRGRVVELLHDRSVAGMRAASHLLGLALREMLDAGADDAIAWSLPHSGSYPLYLRHLFSRARASTDDRCFGAVAFDAAIEHIVTDRRHWYLSGLDVDVVDAT